MTTVRKSIVGGVTEVSRLEPEPGGSGQAAKVGFGSRGGKHCETRRCRFRRGYLALAKE